MIARRALVLAAAAGLLAGPAGAAGTPKSAGGAFANLTVDLPVVIAPVTVRGRLANYIFITMRMHFSSGSAAQRGRERQEVLRDAFIRALHRTPVTAEIRGGPFAVEAAIPGLIAVARPLIPNGGAQLSRIEIVQVEALSR